MQGGGGPEKRIFISNDSFATIYGKDCLNSQKKFEKRSPVHEKYPNMKKASQFYSNSLAAILTFTWPK